VIDGQPLVRLGIREALEAGFVLHEAATRDEALDLVRDVGDFDVAIVDMRWRGGNDANSMTGPEAIRMLHRSSPSLGIVAHGEVPERHLASAAIQGGASAYVSRISGPQELRRAVEAAVAQEKFVDPAVPPKGSRGKLTRRHRQILQRLANGESTTVAARELDLSEETVKTHMKNAMARLGAKNRTHAVSIALRECLID
jgi:DNA-binding NarL/FixJ family response regulator